MYVNSTVEYYNNRIFVVTYAINTSAGGIHPYDEMRLFMVDLKTLKKIHLKDFFKPKSRYLSFLSEYTKKSLSKTLQTNEKDIAQAYWIASGASPDQENFSVVFPRANGLVIHFDSYEVGCYADGPQEVVIPYKVLSTLLKPDGPLGEFAKRGL